MTRPDDPVFLTSSLGEVSGLTKRELFAALILAVNSKYRPPGWYAHANGAVIDAVYLADRLIEALNQKRAD